jgi:hypothetical protein
MGGKRMAVGPSLSRLQDRHESFWNGREIRYGGAGLPMGANGSANRNVVP